MSPLGCVLREGGGCFGDWTRALERKFSCLFVCLFSLWSGEGSGRGWREMWAGEGDPSEGGGPGFFVSLRVFSICTGENGAGWAILCVRGGWGKEKRGGRSLGVRREEGREGRESQLRTLIPYCVLCRSLANAHQFSCTVMGNHANNGVYLGKTRFLLQNCWNLCLFTHPFVLFCFVINGQKYSISLAWDTI